MPNKSKSKGNAYEREIVQYFKDHGIHAVRAWGSNGKSLGLAEEVDLLINNTFKAQLKRRKSLPKWIGLTNEVDASILREDRGTNYVLIRLDDFVGLL